MVDTDDLTEAARPCRRDVGMILWPWLISIILTAPALLPYISHFASPPRGRLPTGFIMFDMAYYISNAREHLDNGTFRLFFSNPFDSRYEAPAIYLQPMSLALGAFLRTPGIDPGLLFVGFEVLAVWACGRVAYALYEEIVGLGSWPRRFGIVAFFWGGGLLALAGISYSLLKNGVVEDIFRFDPFQGYWFLNFGRNLVIPTEALYHALFFGSVLCILRRRFLAAVVLAFLVSMSHPFTGVELLLILATWSALELYFVRSPAVPGAFFLAIIVLLVMHIGYYLAYLARFPEHREIMKSWSLDWTLQAHHFMPAYALVGLLAFWSFRRLDLARHFFSESRNRLFLTWFLVAFTLANHEFAIRPIQPLHFTRGYIWTPLFFMGATPLVALFTGLHRLGNPVLRAVGVAVVLTVFLLDNALWLGQFSFASFRGEHHGLTVTASELDLYRWLSRDENRGGLLLTDDRDMGYLASVYTPLRTWIGGHPYNTPEFDKRREEMVEFLKEGRMVDAWSGRKLLLIIDKTAPMPHPLSEDWGRPIYENENYLAYRREPARSGP